MFRSKGSVLVDYFVELSENGRQVSTQDMKRLFNEGLNHVVAEASAEEDDEEKEDGETEEKTKKILKLGRFVVDPRFTDFIGEFLQMNLKLIIIFRLAKRSPWH